LELLRALRAARKEKARKGEKERNQLLCEEGVTEDRLESGRLMEKAALLLNGLQDNRESNRVRWRKKVDGGGKKGGESLSEASNIGATAEKTLRGDL